MSVFSSLRSTQIRLSAFALLSCSLGAACSGDDGNPDRSGGSGASSGGQATGGQGTTSGGTAGTTGGTAGVTGGASTGGTTGDGGATGVTGGASAGGTTGDGGTTAEAGGAPNGGDGGSPSGGNVGDGGSASGGGDAGGPFACTREFLDSVADDYFTALGANDPSTLPLAGGAKFTENAVVTEIGTTDFWMNAGAVKHSQRLLDTTECSVAAHAVVPESGTDLPIALRLKVEQGELSEVETIIARQGDYTASYATDNDPQEIINLSTGIGWHDEVPEADRPTRDELISWMDNYFRAFPNGVCNATSECRRRENGGGLAEGDFRCSTGAGGCSMSPSAGGMIPRLILADEVRGIVIGLTNFNFMANGHLDMHMAKMSGGQVHAVQAILVDTGGESGWE